jgi:DNA-binding response OmpR family regulator
MAGQNDTNRLGRYGGGKQDLSTYFLPAPDGKRTEWHSDGKAGSQMNDTVRVKDLSALLVGEYEIDDGNLVHEVFKNLGWRLFETHNREFTMECLEHNLVQVVISKADVANWNWRHVLNDLQGLAKPPQLIVTSRTAEESLWAEVLNTGGYDLMALPFERFEVERVIASAYRHFRSLLPVAVSTRQEARGPAKQVSGRKAPAARTSSHGSF